VSLQLFKLSAQKTLSNIINTMSANTNSSTWHNIQCMVCGGKSCKKENVSTMKSGTPAIDGLHSNFVTDRMIASQRPSSNLIQHHNIIQQFIDKGVTAIFNLQESGEHPLCGDGIHGKSGFSYLPEEFMNHNIRYYNFAWQDLSTPNNEQFAMNIMHVLESEVKNGKALIHCHAGLGRTGLVCACYLLYSKQFMQPDKALEYVRKKRPGSIETSHQVKFVYSFYRHLVHSRTVFLQSSLSLSEYMKKQRQYLHGMESRTCKHVPKIIYYICDRFLIVLSQEDNRSIVLSELVSQLKRMYGNKTMFLRVEHNDNRLSMNDKNALPPIQTPRSPMNTSRGSASPSRTPLDVLLNRNRRASVDSNITTRSRAFSIGTSISINSSISNSTTSSSATSPSNKIKNESRFSNKLTRVKLKLNVDDWNYIQNKCTDLQLLVCLWIDFIRQLDNDPILPYSFMETIHRTYSQEDDTDSQLPSIETLAHTTLDNTTSIEIFKCVVNWLSNLTIQNDHELLQWISELGGIVLLAHCTSRTILPYHFNNPNIYQMMNHVAKYCILNHDVVKKKK
jgi:hypothetical protein